MTGRAARCKKCYSCSLQCSLVGSLRGVFLETCVVLSESALVGLIIFFAFIRGIPRCDSMAVIDCVSLRSKSRNC